MVNLNIKIVSKNKQAVKFFFLFFNKINNPKFNLITNFKKQKTLIKKITTLKSPHVNKKAQKHFELRTFSKEILIDFFNEINFLVFLKILKITLFPEIKLKITIFLKKNNSLLNLKKYSINYINYKKSINQKFNFKKINNIKPCKKTKNYLKILDFCGELKIR